MERLIEFNGVKVVLTSAQAMNEVVHYLDEADAFFFSASPECQRIIKYCDRDLLRWVRARVRYEGYERCESILARPGTSLPRALTEEWKARRLELLRAEARLAARGLRVLAADRPKSL